jgi:type II secretory pathway component GspD/PulD (secretin)
MAFERRDFNMMIYRVEIRNFALASAAFAVAALLLVPPAQAQESETRSNAKPDTDQTQTFFLKNITERNDLNDITTDLRNVLNRAKIYGVASQNAITMHATAEDLQTAQKLLTEIDRPKKVYRITYTITESDNGMKTGVQHYSLVVGSDNKSAFKQGTRVPIVTGAIDKDTSSPMTQIQYLDVGVNIEAYVSGVGLHTKIEQSSIADEKSNVGIQDPVVRQTMLEGTATFTPGKAIALGSIDIPGTTRHQDVEMVAELVP